MRKMLIIFTVVTPLLSLVAYAGRLEQPCERSVEEYVNSRLYNIATQDRSATSNTIATDIIASQIKLDPSNLTEWSYRVRGTYTLAFDGNIELARRGNSQNPPLAVNYYNPIEKSFVLKVRVNQKGFCVVSE